MLIEEIKKSNIESLKNKDTVSRSFYSVLLNKIKLEEIKKREKNESITDVDVIQILQKTLKELDEEKMNYVKVNNIMEVENIEKQKQIALKYLPQMMSEEEIKNIIAKLDDKSIGNVMKHFKLNYAGKCDMKIVNEILKGF